MKNLTQCALWKDPETTVARPMHEQFEQLECFFKESHWWRYLLKCRDCGQMYVFEFDEEIDWVDGDDPSFCTWVPVETAEDIQAVRSAPRAGLGPFVPRLCRDWPKGEKPKLYWVRDATMGAP